MGTFSGQQMLLEEHHGQSSKDQTEACPTLIYLFKMLHVV